MLASDAKAIADEYIEKNSLKAQMENILSKIKMSAAVGLYRMSFMKKFYPDLSEVCKELEALGYEINLSDFLEDCFSVSWKEPHQ